MKLPHISKQALWNTIELLRLEKPSKIIKFNLQVNTIMSIKPYHRLQVEAVSPPPWGSLEHIHLQLLHLHREPHGHISFGKKQPSLNIQSETDSWYWHNDDTFLAFWFLLEDQRCTQKNVISLIFLAFFFFFPAGSKKGILALKWKPTRDGWCRLWLCTLCSCPDVEYSHAHAAAGWKDKAVTSKHCFWMKPSHPHLSTPSPLPLMVQAKKFALAYAQAEWRD